MLFYAAGEEGFEQVVRPIYTDRSVLYAHSKVLANARASVTLTRCILSELANVLPPQLQIHEEQVESVFRTLIASMFSDSSLENEILVRDGAVFLRAIATD